MIELLFNNVAGLKACCDILKSSYFKDNLLITASELTLGSDYLELFFRTVAFNPEL